ncbi:MAG TPA: YraN family protein [Candidatus Sulfomarinibacteraceae bacterium]|nr:YraN family protein [Candidatus Sulfomarinibacteraceae bacterium]
MSDARKRLGAWGESLAARHLEEQGYEILERNWRCTRGEIDLVAQAGDLLLFVEVKTRRGRRMGLPEDGLTARKSQKLLQLAEIFIYEHEIRDVNWRVDLVAVELDSSGKLLRCEHIPNAVRGW